MQGRGRSCKALWEFSAHNSPPPLPLDHLENWLHGIDRKTEFMYVSDSIIIATIISSILNKQYCKMLWSIGKYSFFKDLKTYYLEDNNLER
jgi:hypothetical protein